MIRTAKTTRFLLCSIATAVMGSFLFTPLVQAKDTWDYPRLANYFLDHFLYRDEAKLLAPWDVLVLSAETQDFRPEALTLLRELNPDIILLAYVSGTSVSEQPVSQEFPSLAALGADQIPDSWWLRSSSGERVGYWPGAKMINVTDQAPLVNGQRWNDWLPEMIADKVYATGYWDGIFIDEAFGVLSWLNGGDLDLNGDGLAEAGETINTELQAGLNKLLSNLRQELGDEAYIVVNGSSVYGQSTNGRMFENAFKPDDDWTSQMTAYLDVPASFSPRLSLVNANTSNSGVINYQQAVYALASTLLGDGFFSYDHGDGWHQSIWWLDEYKLSLGQPVSSAYDLLNSENSSQAPGFWRRDFTRGSVLVNSTNETQLYEFTLNDGTAVSGELAARSGRLLSSPVQVESEPIEPDTSDIEQIPTNSSSGEGAIETNIDSQTNELAISDQGAESRQGYVDLGQALAADQPDYPAHPPFGAVFGQGLASNDSVAGSLKEGSNIANTQARSQQPGFYSQLIHKSSYLGVLKTQISAIWHFIAALVF